MQDIECGIQTEEPKLGDRKKWGRICARLAGAALFVVIGLFIFGRASETLRKKTGGYPDMIHSFYDIEKNSLDVLVLGSSHGYHSFQPNLLWKECGLASYVMCSQRQSVAQSWYLLQEALKYQKPKVVLLEAYYFFLDHEHTGEVSIRYAYDGMRFSRLKYDMIEDFREGMTWKEKLTYYIPFLKYHSRWSELSDDDFNSRPWLKGSVLTAKTEAVPEPELPEEGRKVSSVFYDYFGRIADTCRENGIELVVYLAPFTWEDDTGQGRQDFARMQSAYLTLEPYVRGMGIPFLSYQEGNRAGIDFRTDFSDYSHLNTNGAVKITRALAGYLEENYDLPDHRGEAAYASWDEDYKKFAAQAEELDISFDK